LAARIDFRIQVILTGGAVAVLEGSGRVTRDLDFQIVFSSRSAHIRQAFQEAVERTSQITGISAQYDESIESWSSIAWPRRKPRSRLYKRFGKVEVHLLDTLLWSIGKLGRYLSSDVADLAMVLKRTRIRAREAVQAWGEALGRSPASSAQPLFKRQVLHFLQQYGKSLWGKRIRVDALEKLFLESARSARR